MIGLNCWLVKASIRMTLWIVLGKWNTQLFQKKTYFYNRLNKTSLDSMDYYINTLGKSGPFSSVRAFWTKLNFTRTMFQFQHMSRKTLETNVCNHMVWTLLVTIHLSWSAMHTMIGVKLKLLTDYNKIIMIAKVIKVELHSVLTDPRMQTTNT